MIAENPTNTSVRRPSLSSSVVNLKTVDDKNETSSQPSPKHSTTKEINTSGHASSKNEDSSSSSSPSILRFGALSLFYNASTSCIQPFLPVYFDSLGHPTHTIGMLQSLSSVTAILAAPMWGMIADRTGRTGGIFTLTFSMSAIAQLCLLFPAREKIWFLAITSILFSAFFAPTKSLLDMIVISNLPSDQKSKFGQISSWAQIGTWMTSSMMVMLMNESTMGFQIAFIASAVLSLPILLCMLTSSSSSNQTTKQQQKHPSNPSPSNNGILTLLKDTQVLLFFFQILLFGFSIGFMETFAYVQIRQSFAKSSSIGQNVSVYLGLCRTCLSFGSVFTYRLSGRIIETMGVDRVMFGTMVGLALCFLFYAQIDGDDNVIAMIGSMLAAEAVRGCLYAIFASATTIHAVRISPPGMDSLMRTLMESLNRGVGVSCGAILGGKLVSELGGISAAFLYASKAVFTIACISFFFGSGSADGMVSPIKIRSTNAIDSCGTTSQKKETHNYFEGKKEIKTL